MDQRGLLEGERLLCRVLDITPEEYIEILLLEDRYRSHKLGKHTISVPTPILKVVQERLHRIIGLRLMDNFVFQKFDPNTHHYYRFHGFLRNKSILTAVHPHADSEYFFKLDLKNAFGSTKRNFLITICFPALMRILWRESMFQKSKLFSKSLCGRFNASISNHFLHRQSIVDVEAEFLRGRFHRYFLQYKLNRHLTYLLYEFTVAVVDLITDKDSLPKGAPTSPDFFVYATYADGLIKKIHLALENNGIKHPIITIYADDIIISSNQPIPKKVREKVVTAIEAKPNTFSVNRGKIHYYRLNKCSPRMLGLSLRVKIDWPPIQTVRMLEGRQITLRRKDQDRFRAILHSAYQNPGDEKLSRSAMGITAHICRIFPPKLLPSRLRRPMANFLKMTGAKPYYLKAIPLSDTKPQ
ncbi:hypothetical protein HYV44_00060 [Candidatus Microgenomates bacterium]|nr:hypothetical protein [Candidatus Microgenomates bacterium]